ncbi:hypothetical protein ACCO45_004661 [Purpureocillium lilacinum]|uniref:Uncharacterized protein n=1 Tax=Purpureocillium lilacinum TaxID=33203 RepID=A0ACC4DUI0_PURLI
MQPTRLLLQALRMEGAAPRAPSDRVPQEAGRQGAPVRTQARSATILPSFVGLKFEIHNGKDYHQVVITEDMVGHKLGEFSPTRKPNIWDRK